MVSVSKKDLHFLTLMAVFVVIVFALYREEIVGPLLAPLAMLTAKMTFALLQWLGTEAVRNATVIYQPGGFAYDVSYTCTGILPITFLVAAMLAYPVPFAYRVIGVIVGTTILLLLNFGRLVHLFQIGVHNPGNFDFWHEDLWQGIIRLSILCLWMTWAVWAERQSKAKVALRRNR